MKEEQAVQKWCWVSMGTSELHLCAGRMCMAWVEEDYLRCSKCGNLRYSQIKEGEPCTLFGCTGQMKKNDDGYCDAIPKELDQ